MEAEPLNPYEASAAAEGDVRHHFHWRSAGTMLIIGSQEQHDLAVRIDLLFAKTIVELDGQIVRSMRYFFDPPPIRLEVGATERHQIEVVLVTSMLRPSQIKVDGEIVVPEVFPQFVWLCRSATSLTVLAVTAWTVFEYWDPIRVSDWYSKLLVHLAAGLTLLLVAILALIDGVGFFRRRLSREESVIRPPTPG